MRIMYAFSTYVLSIGTVRTAGAKNSYSIKNKY